MSRLSRLWLAPILFSVIYFLDVGLRASEKYFWYDELFTIYFAKLPTLRALWAALQSGIDFNPPPFYLLTRATYQLLGNGNVSMRLPEIIAFWVFCLCLYLFVSRSSGVLAGTAAMLLPMTTEAYYYAYEARPHALVLGFCGLALVCWQNAIKEQDGGTLAKAAFGIALFGAFMMHCFALTLLAPFGLTELVRTSSNKKIDWGLWTAMATASVAAVLMYVPLLSSFRKLTAGTTFAEVSPAGWKQVAHYFDFLLRPCLPLLLAILLLFILGFYVTRRNYSPEPEARQPDLKSRAAEQEFCVRNGFSLEIVLALSFLALPLFGVALGKIVHGPFFNRYFLAAVGGLAILVGSGCGRNVQNRIAAFIVLALAATVALNLSDLLFERSQGKGEWLLEPSSQLLLDTTPGQPLYLHRLLLEDHSSLPIAVLNPFEFIYLVHYAPALKSRLFLVEPSRSSFTYIGFERLLSCCEVQFHPPLVYDQFVSAYPEYLAYGNPGNFDHIALLTALHSQIDSMLTRGDHFLVRLSPKRKE